MIWRIGTPFEASTTTARSGRDRNYWRPKRTNTMASCTCWRASREDLCRGTAILTADNPLGLFVPYSDGRAPSNWEP
ncbi:MAG: hypothetical protein ACLT1X_07610 [Christensenellales bacterium]